MTGPTPSSPRCPRCGYDQSGLIATWSHSCPLEFTCSECGNTSLSASLFIREMLGPRWSLEHASRRYIRKWAATTFISLRPTKLWSELRPEHPVFRRRLAWMALSWLALLHLTCAAIVEGSWLLMSAYGAGATPSWSSWSLTEWGFWRFLLIRLVWPYSGAVEIPFSSSQSFMNPVDGFVMMSLMPLLFMGAIMGLWLRLVVRLDSRHIERAMCLMLPGVVAWFVAVVGLFAAMGLISGPNGPDDFMGVVFLAVLAGFVLYVIWWWRCFAVRYAGRKKHTWLFLPLGLVAVFMGWATAVVLDELLSRH